MQAVFGAGPAECAACTLTCGAAGSEFAVAYGAEHAALTFTGAAQIDVPDRSFHCPEFVPVTGMIAVDGAGVFLVTGAVTFVAFVDLGPVALLAGWIRNDRIFLTGTVACLTAGSAARGAGAVILLFSPLVIPFAVACGAGIVAFSLAHMAVGHACAVADRTDLVSHTDRAAAQQTILDFMRTGQVL